MADPDDLTADVQDYALGTLAEWIKGYTVPEEGPQQKCTLLAVAEDGRSIDIQMETCDPFPYDAKVFRIWLEVEAL
ncbi:hypothetical protein [Streptomyces nitrosporeus]|uniref:hypothetical protein n=1 Tax=Streptomyces nitrosporeus TaxID=28894 RepID=UPI00142EC6A8|nr:hypothetical protein [Streptomyces nitrosporeus]GGY88820.1 hypothetical protein GCM10010327_19440 [Streptomyces nitrosporeus]